MTPVASECRRTGGVVFEAAYTGTVVGGIVSSDDLPPQSALVVTINTGKVGRRFRGRLYVPGFPEASQVSGTFAAGTLTTITTAANTFSGLYASTGTDATWTQGVWSERVATGCKPDKATGKLVNVDVPNLAAAFSASLSLIPRSTVFTQRRRALGVGR